VWGGGTGCYVDDFGGEFYADGLRGEDFPRGIYEAVEDAGSVMRVLVSICSV
jgi:hypothetical protein